MKRITSITVENYRAFPGYYEPIDLGEGQNLLIYGENGSGKSSLFKAVNNFFSSSRNTSFPYIKNHHQLLHPGYIRLIFDEFDSITKVKTSRYGEIITFGSEESDTNTSGFVMTTELIKGFLDYRKLLDIYNHKDPRPNLFELVVVDLLGNFIPPGGTISIGKKWLELYEDSRNVYNRRERKHQRALGELPTFELALRTCLDLIFLVVNGMLMKYFKLNLRLTYALSPFLPYNYDPENWHPTANLRLDIKFNGVNVVNVGDVLNEARLSAVSICIYLATLLRNPQVSVDYKILYLDDVFVGLDTGNRIPILNILNDYFSDYQIFISTYDRNWFELAKNFFSLAGTSKWKFTELYAGYEPMGHQLIEKPIIVLSENNYERGTFYLHHRTKPDLAAAANYFRKAFEELLSDWIPPWELAGDENVKIPDYKLGVIADRGRRFLKKTDISTATFDKIYALLHALLHPLSHHNIYSDIYRKELVIIETYLPILKKELYHIDIQNEYKCSLLEGRNLIQIRYIIDTTTAHYSYYELRTLEPLVLIQKPGTTLNISRVKCVIEKCWGEQNGKIVPRSKKEFSTQEKTHADLNFESLLTAYNNIHAAIIKFPAIGNFAKDPDYINTMKYKDTSGVFRPLSDVIVW